MYKTFKPNYFFILSKPELDKGVKRGIRLKLVFISSK